METGCPTKASTRNKFTRSPAGNVASTATELNTFVSAKKKDPFIKVLIIIAACLIFLMGLVVYTSVRNTKNYYLRSSAGAVEIWQGTFSPAGKKRLIIMAGARPPKILKAVYSREEVYPLIFSYYIDKADALIHVPGMPDFVGIKTYLNQAMAHASSQTERKKAQARINLLDRKILFYKADVAASRGDVDGWQAAMVYLDQAAQLDPDEIEAELIRKKKRAILELAADPKTDDSYSRQN